MPEWAPIETRRAKDNPFYHNYVFSQADLDRAKIKWWHYPLLWFRPMLVQISDGQVFYYKTWMEKYFFVKVEPLASLPEPPEGSKQ